MCVGRVSQELLPASGAALADLSLFPFVRVRNGRVPAVLLCIAAVAPAWYALSVRRARSYLTDTRATGEGGMPRDSFKGNQSKGCVPASNFAETEQQYAGRRRGTRSRGRLSQQAGALTSSGTILFIAE